MVQVKVRHKQQVYLAGILDEVEVRQGADARMRGVNATVQHNSLALERQQHAGASDFIPGTDGHNLEHVCVTNGNLNRFHLHDEQSIQCVNIADAVLKFWSFVNQINVRNKRAH